MVDLAIFWQFGDFLYTMIFIVTVIIIIILMALRIKIKNFLFFKKNYWNIK